MEYMKEYYLSSCIKIKDSQSFQSLSKYINKEYKDINKIYKELNPSETIYQITLDDFTSLPNLSKSIYSLGKGLFYDVENDIIFISIFRDTGFFNLKNIIYCIKDLKNFSNEITIYINKINVIKQPLSSYLKFIFNFLRYGDNRNSFEIFSEIFVSQVIEPLIYYLLSKNKSLLLHAAGLFKEKGILIFGPQNIGKTSTALALAKNFAWQILGDDFVILDHKKDICDFPKPLKIEPEQLKKFFSIKIRKKGFLPNLIKSNYEFKVSYKDFNLEISKKGKVSILIFLNRVLEIENKISCKKLTRKESFTLLKNHGKAEFDTNKHVFRDIRELLAIQDENFKFEIFNNELSQKLLYWLSENTDSYSISFSKDVTPQEISNEIEKISQIN